MPTPSAGVWTSKCNVGLSLTWLLLSLIIPGTGSHHAPLHESVIGFFGSVSMQLPIIWLLHTVRAISENAPHTVSLLNAAYIYKAFDTVGWLVVQINWRFQSLIWNCFNSKWITKSCISRWSSSKNRYKWFYQRKTNTCTDTFNTYLCIIFTPKVLLAVENMTQKNRLKIYVDSLTNYIACVVNFIYIQYFLTALSYDFLCTDTESVDAVIVSRIKECSPNMIYIYLPNAASHVRPCTTPTVHYIYDKLYQVSNKDTDHEYCLPSQTHLMLFNIYKVTGTCVGHSGRNISDLENGFGYFWIV